MRATLLTLAILAAACSTQAPDPDTPQPLPAFDVGYPAPAIPHRLEPWGACGEADSECDPGYTCVTMEPSLGICVKDTPCPSEALDRPVADDGAWCRIVCETDADCLPDYGLLCSETGGCGWDMEMRV